MVMWDHRMQAMVQQNRDQCHKRKCDQEMRESGRVRTLEDIYKWPSTGTEVPSISLHCHPLRVWTSRHKISGNSYIQIIATTSIAFLCTRGPGWQWHVHAGLSIYQRPCCSWWWFVSGWCCTNVVLGDGNKQKCSIFCSFDLLLRRMGEETTWEI